MAKNTSKKSAKKKNSFFKKISSLKWYTKLFLLIAVILLLFLAFKEGVNRYNISLLDQAETKMRAMDLPEADHTEYKRSCSFRSVKFGSAGSPNCDVWRTDIFNTKDVGESYEVSRDYLDHYKTQYSDSTLNYTNELDFTKRLTMGVDENPTVVIAGMQEGLKCYVNAGIESKLPNSIESYGELDGDAGYLIITTSCYKKFMFQTYPEI